MSERDLSTKAIRISFISRTRRNHGLEHATINVLSERQPSLRLAGYSSPFGFSVIGPVPMSDLVSAIEEAQRRIAQGRCNLVIHDHCGTNYVAGGLLAGSAAWLGMLGVKRGLRGQLERLPMVIFLSTLALLFSPSLGVWMQKKITTSSELDGLEVVKITQSKLGKYPRFQIQTRY
jgi:hypothetical protein